MGHLQPKKNTIKYNKYINTFKNRNPKILAFTVYYFVSVLF